MAVAFEDLGQHQPYKHSQWSQSIVFLGLDAYRPNGRGDVTPFESAIPRQPQLYKNAVCDSVCWFTKADGDTYLGRVGEVRHRDAKKLFADHLVKVQADEGDRKRGGLTAGDRVHDRLCDSKCLGPQSE